MKHHETLRESDLKPEVSQEAIDAFIYASGKDYRLSDVTEEEYGRAYLEFLRAVDANDFQMCRWAFQSQYPDYPITKIERNLGLIEITTSVVRSRKNRAGTPWPSVFRAEELVVPDPHDATCAIKFSFTPEFRDDDPSRENWIALSASAKVKRRFDEYRQTTRT